MGQQPTILVVPLRPAINGASGKQLAHAITRRLAAGPLPSVACGAVLRKFGSIYAEQAHPILPQPEAVAIAGTALPPDRWWGSVEQRRTPCGTGQNEYGQNRAAAAGEPSMTCQDFTTC